MIKILIEDKLYNIKDEDYKKLRDTGFIGEKYDQILEEIENTYEIRDYIQVFRYDE